MAGWLSCLLGRSGYGIDAPAENVYVLFVISCLIHMTDDMFVPLDLAVNVELLMLREKITITNYKEVLAS